ncbi:MAG: hypothetical protein CL607_22690 [Anaerolineaceae bacterium]|nr:hypothetical protein [Anaerolineaceae bacterium]
MVVGIAVWVDVWAAVGVNVAVDNRVRVALAVAEGNGVGVIVLVAISVSVGSGELVALANIATVGSASSVGNTTIPVASWNSAITSGIMQKKIINPITAHLNIRLHPRLIFHPFAIISNNY